jgi:N-acetylglutamate synthase-like GNAT family acetyltransferase
MMAPMSPGPLQIRRATVDDLPALRALWETARLPADDLENRLTEFHVVESDGNFAGALGIQVIRQYARIHSEDYADFSVADSARELFWERIQKLSANLGVFRVWTQETSPFWTRWGFQPANTETLARLPDEWKTLEGRWLTLELKNEEAISHALKTQVTGMMDVEREQTARLASQARGLRLIVTIFLFVVAAIFFGGAVVLLMRRMNPH